MRVIREVKMDAKTVTVRELLVSDLRAMLFDSELNLTQNESIDMLDIALFDDIKLHELKHMTDLTDEDINALAPSEVQTVVDMCLEVNKHFFAMRKKLQSMGKNMVQSAD